MRALGTGVSAVEGLWKGLMKRVRSPISELQSEAIKRKEENIDL